MWIDRVGIRLSPFGVANDSGVGQAEVDHQNVRTLLAECIDCSR